MNQGDLVCLDSEGLAHRPFTFRIAENNIFDAWCAALSINDNPELVWTTWKRHELTLGSVTCLWCVACLEDVD